MSIETNLKYLFLKKSTLGNIFSKEKGGLLNIPILIIDTILSKIAPIPVNASLAATSFIFLDSSAITSIFNLHYI